MTGGRFLPPLLLALGLVRPGSAVEERGARLALGGASAFAIHVADGAPAELLDEAGLLRTYLRRVTGAELPVLRGAKPGRERIALELLPEGDAESEGLGPEGFRIRVRDERIDLAARTPLGLRHAVRAFLEDEIGCRRFSPEEEFTPSRPDLDLQVLDVTQVPRFAFRMQDFKDPEYSAWRRLNTRDDWGLFVHTFHELVPPERWFAEHPEYFSENLGVRVADGQLCLSHPDVLRLTVEDLRRRMAGNPRAGIWSVSQNDTYLPCACAACRAVDEEEGSPSGSLLRFVNAVAAEFPGKTISTLAYQYTRRPPELTKPLPNVNIVLCSIESGRERPIEQADPGFARDLAGWARLTDNLLVWDYVIQFHHLLAPFPNLRVLQPNLRFFAAQGASAVFEQGLAEMKGEFAELRAWLLSKLLWNPDADVDALLDDFLGHYYGAAAGPVRAYIDEMHDALERSGEGLSCFGRPAPSADGFLSQARLARYGELFDRAEAAVAGDGARLERVRRARLPLQYARLEQARELAIGPGGCFEPDAAARRGPRPEIVALADSFHVRCLRYGIPRLHEHGRSPEEFRAGWERFLAESCAPHLGLGRPVALAAPASPSYAGGEASRLSDGLVGLDDYRQHWLGFEGVDLDATVDLGREQPVSRVATAFLQDVDSWIFLPTAVEIFVSRDGTDYETVGAWRPEIDPREPGALRWPVSADFAARPARFVRLEAIGWKRCPAWHKGAGGQAWVFCDEISVH